MRSGTNLIYSKAVLNNQDEEALTMADIGGVRMQLHSGYPVGNWMNGIRYIINLDDVEYSRNGAICTSNWCGMGNATTIPSGISTTSPGRIGKVFPRGYSWNDQCGVYYMNHENGSAPEIGLETQDCK